MWLAVVVLAIVEGLTEFLPISSTGHLVVAASLLGFEPKWKEPFLVILQLGAIAAVVWDRFPQLVHMARGDPRRLVAAARKLALAFLPSAIVALLLRHVISSLLESPISVSAAWIVGGVLILLVDREGAFGRPARSQSSPDHDDFAGISTRQAFLVGIFQCLALWPGISRSGATIIGGLVVGLDRRSATLFSFYLAIPTMFAASAFELVRFRGALDGSLPFFLIGLPISFVVALATVRWLRHFVETHSFLGFAYYRIVAGFALLLLPHRADD